MLLRALRGCEAGGFFQKTSLFNDDLSNEPNFGQILLAGPLMQKCQRKI